MTTIGVPNTALAGSCGLMVIVDPAIPTSERAEFTLFWTSEFVEPESAATRAPRLAT